MLSELTLLLISLLSFLLPSQLALHFDLLSPTVYGFKIDYLIPTLYLTDIIVFLIILVNLKNLNFNRKKIILWFSYLIFVILNIAVSGYFVASVYRWIKITEVVLLGAVIYNTKKFDVFKHFVAPLSYFVLLVSLLGIAQYFNSGSIGGIFYWLGERKFLFSDPNISPFPYGTFSHPNSFAGFLLVFGVFLLEYRTKFKNKYFWLLLLLILINIFLTNSLNIYLTIGLLLLLRFKSNLSYLMFFDFTQRSFAYRIELMKSSWEMIKENFWLGVGLNNFIPNLVKVSKLYVNSWELQPVHNIFLLIFSEAGIIGFLAFLYIILNLTFSYQLVAILFSGLFDHYWLTLQQNLLLFTFVVVISLRKKK